MAASTHFPYALWQQVASRFRNRRPRITPLMRETLPAMRAALIQVALRRGTTTYSELSVSIDGRYGYHHSSLNDALDIISRDCEEHGEPSLAALVVLDATGEPGDAFVGDAVAVGQECYEYWAERLQRAKARSSHETPAQRQ